MSRYTIRGYKYGDTECPMSKLQDLENKIEDGVLVKASELPHANCFYAAIDHITNEILNKNTEE